MIHIKKFVDKISYMDSKQNRDVILPMAEARGLRDEITKLLLDLNELKDTKKIDNNVIDVQIVGGRF
jgi:undecaprenyl pyrophosphate synthase